MSDQPLHDSERSSTQAHDRWISRSTLLAMVVAVGLAYPATVFLIGSKDAIEAWNPVLFALAGGVATAYAPTALTVLCRPRVSRSDVLALGIFIAWVAVIIARGGSITWRYLGSPPLWLDNAWWGAHVAVSAIAALCHLVAPEAVAGVVPTREWVRIGCWVAAGMLAAGLIAQATT